MMPSFFQAIHPWLPFTYSIDAMRQAIGGLYGSAYVTDLLILLLFVPLGLFIGLVLGRYAFNLNILFDGKLAATNLYVCEQAEGASERPRFRMRAMMQALLDMPSYRTALKQRAAAFRRAYPWLKRAAWVLIFLQPLVTFAIMVLLRANIETKVVLMVAMAVSAYEAVFGFLLMCGCYKRVAPWALMASMAMMLPLTAYIAIASPVADCGCFGDFWVISNTATFLKNIVLTSALVFLIIYSPHVKTGLYKPAIQWLVGATVTLYMIIIGLYGYNIQPMLDFRPYPPGSSLVADAGNNDDDAMPTFIYEKDGEHREFAADDLPDDSTWIFVERKEAPATKNSNPGIFAIYDGDDEVTGEAITGEGKELLLVIPELRRADISYTYYINDLYEKADSAGISMVALIGASEKGIEMWKDFSMASYPCYSVEDTALKELSRGVMSLVLLDNGRIKGKATVSSLVSGKYNDPNTLAAVAELSDTPHAAIFGVLSAITGAFLLFIYLFQGIILAIRATIRKKIRKTA